MEYNWQRADWPEFPFDPIRVEEELLAFADKAGQVGGLLPIAQGGTNAE